VTNRRSSAIAGCPRLIGVRSAPRWWFWSHDIEPHQVADLHPGRAVQTDLTADELTALIDGGQTVVDLATYLRDGSRCFAAIVEPGDSGGCLFFPSLSPDEVRPTLGPRGVLPTRVRPYHVGPAGWRLAASAERGRGTAWSVVVVVDVDDVDDVSGHLEKLRAYPLDLDAVGHGLSVRFALVAAK
jgi:hypothetical protein